MSDQDRPGPDQTQSQVAQTNTPPVPPLLDDPELVVEVVPGAPESRHDKDR